MKTILLGILLLTWPAIASTKHAPLADSLVQAKSIYIDNQTGLQEVTDSAYNELIKWGHYAVVMERSKADLVATFTIVDRLVEGTTIQSVQLVVTGSGMSDPLFEEVSMAKGFHTPKNRMALSAKNCIQVFEKRLEP